MGMFHLEKLKSSAFPVIAPKGIGNKKLLNTINKLKSRLAQYSSCKAGFFATVF